MKNRRNSQLKKLIVLTMFAAIVAVLGMTPLGLIPLPFVNLTILHIPVIVGAVLLGWKHGAVLGFVFGLISCIKNTYAPTSVLAFVFSPFIEPGTLSSLIICFVPRILVGIIAGAVPKAMRRVNSYISGIVAGVLGTLANCFGFSFGVYFLLKDEFEATSPAGDSAFNMLVGIFTANGVFEVIAAAVLVPAIVVPLKRYLKKNPL